MMDDAEAVVTSRRLLVVDIHIDSSRAIGHDLETTQPRDLPAAQRLLRFKLLVHSPCRHKRFQGVRSRRQRRILVSLE